MMFDPTMQMMPNEDALSFGDEYGNYADVQDLLLNLLNNANLQQTLLK